MHWPGWCSTSCCGSPLLHCSTKGWGPVCGGPEGPCKLHNDSPSLERPRSSSELVEMSLYSFPFYFVPLARCWIDTAVSVGAEHRSLSQSACPQGDGEGEESDMLRAAEPLSYWKCWDRQEMHWSVSDTLQSTTWCVRWIITFWQSFRVSTSFSLVGTLVMIVMSLWRTQSLSSASPVGCTLLPF